MCTWAHTHTHVPTREGTGPLSHWASCCGSERPKAQLLRGRRPMPAFISGQSHVRASRCSRKPLGRPSQTQSQGKTHQLSPSHPDLSPLTGPLQGGGRDRCLTHPVALGAARSHRGPKAHTPGSFFF